jgi:hypothetical protein
MHARTFWMFALVPLAAAAAPPPDLELVARDMVREMVDGKYDAAEERFDETMQKAVPAAKLAELTGPLRAQRGPARSVIARLRHDEAGGVVQFTLKCTWTHGTPSDFRVWLRPDGKVVGMRVTDEVAPEDLGRADAARTHARLRPPFHGTWTAHNATLDDKNPHTAIRSQRHAVDWGIIGDDGRTYKGDPMKNESYLCWGKEALAVADGTVAVVVDGIPENPVPGHMDSYFIPGNEVVLDLGGGEYAMYMHLRPGSPVKVGQRVKAGDVVGRVGNSGNASEAHLHFQVADSPRIVDCKTLPARYSHVHLDGKLVEEALPGERQTLSESLTPR